MLLTETARKTLAEFIGTAFLVCAVVGSGIAAQQLSPGDGGLQLLENAAATAAALVAIILAVGPVSGAHLNPAVTLADRSLGGIDTRSAVGYVGAQISGGALGAVVANVMFSEPAVSWSTHQRSGGGLWVAEAVATYGLVLVVFALVRSGRTSAAPFAVGAYIGGAYFFTASTSFANPAVTLARTLSDTFAGIEPAGAPAFIAAQLLGAATAVATVQVLYPHTGPVTEAAVLPHGDPAHHAVLAERFARDRLHALAWTQGALVSDVPEVLFVCVHNAGRSQMAAALLDHHAQGRVRVRSAGSEPADRINPAVIAALEEIGLDVTKEFPKPLTDEVARAADVIVTMGCGDACPVYPGKRYIDWQLPDPAGKPLEDLRPIRDEIDRRVQHLVAELVA